MEKLNFTDQQTAVIDNRGGSLLVSAAAGTGKTRVLVERVMKKVAEEDCNICDFLIITYTTAAAAELRSRIIGDLSKRSAEEPKNRHLRRQISMAGAANIGTIHSFCGKVIREYAHDLNISPDFRNIDESEIGIIQEAVLNDLIDERYGDMDKFPGFTELVDTLSSGRKDEMLIRTVLDAHNSLQSHPYPSRWIEAEHERLENIREKNLSETAWGSYLVKQALIVTEYWLKEFIDAEGVIECDEKLNKAYGASWHETKRGLGRLRDALQSGSWDDISRVRTVEFPRIGRTPEGFAYLKAGRERCKGDMKKITKTFSLDSDQIIEDLIKSCQIIGAFLSLIKDFDIAYDREKRRKNVLDFSDLEHLALKVLVNEATGEPTEAARDIACVYDEVLVDEFQDVNTVQDMIFTSVTDKNLFVVGDVKQSIYRFRLADPTIFMKYYRKFPDWADASEGESRKVLLSKNFRSDKNVLNAVNFVFQNVMKSGFCGLDYTEREYLVPGIEQESSDSTPVELCILDQAEFVSGEKAEARDIEPRFVAQRVRNLIEEEGYSPGDIVILLRSMSGKAWRYERELKSQGIPTALGGSEFFHSREIMSLTAALDIIDNPTRDISLIAAMSSPLFGFTPDELAEIKCGYSGGSFFDALNRFSGENQKCREFLETLKKLRNIAPDLSVENLLWQVLEETGALSIYGAMDNGDIRRGNIMRLLEYAGAYEAKGYRGLFRFLEMFRDAGEKGKLSGPERTPDGSVRIMSIHSSKGLEFPVAILADMSKDFNKEDLKSNVLLHPRLGAGIRLRDMERKISYSTMPRDAIAEKIEAENRQEEMRILYVAMTRAAKKLIMTCTLKNAEKELIGLYGKMSYPLSPYVIGKVKNMAEWVLLPLMLCPEKEKLGIEGDSYQESVGWDVKLIPCSSFMEDIQAASAAVTESGDKTENIQAEIQQELVEKIQKRVYFKYPYDDLVDLPSKLTATELKSWRSEAAEDAENISKHKAAVRRPSFIMERDELTGAERGTAAHLVMQFADYSNCGSVAGIRAEIKRLESLSLITTQQAESVDPEMLMSFFDSPLGRQVLASRSFRREFKFSLLIPAQKYYYVTGEDEILLQGVIDCFFETDEGITIIDFKTDYVNAETLEEKAASYARQLDVYAYALERITGKQIMHKYLFFFAVGQAVELQ